MLLQENHFRGEDTERLKVKEWKKIFHENGNKKKVGVAILISDKVDFFKVYNNRQRRELYNYKEVNPRRGYIICKHIFT